MAIYDKTNKILYLPSGGGKAIYDEEKIEEAYQSGYTAGYDSGWTDAEEECGERDYSKEYFTIEMLEDGAISPNYPIDYRINGGEWTSYPGDESNIAVNAGDAVEFRGTGDGLLLFDEMGSGRRCICGSCITYGNIMSLSYGDDFQNNTEARNYYSLFAGCSALVDASNLVLPATELLEDSCYSFMFSLCRNLTGAPATLPATSLTKDCYMFMFESTKITTAPELPATTLTNRCYEYMFYGCGRLKTAPELPATTLAERCYRSMFEDCTSLNRVTCSATDISANNCTLTWLRNVYPTGTFVKAHNVEWPTGIDGIPSGWTVIEE